jgi:hypothetical protein
MSDSAPALTPEQEARVQELVQTMLPEIIQAVSEALRTAIQTVNAQRELPQRHR